MKTSTLIYNPIAGRRPGRREGEVRRVAEILRRAGMEVDVAPTAGPGSATRLAARAVTEGREAVLVCGGDGTVNEAINGLTGSGVPLGVLPGGTANILAREMGLPLNPVCAAAEFSRWSPRRIPLGKATWRSGEMTTETSRFFVTLAGVGFDAHVVKEFSLRNKLMWGVTGYIMEAVRQVFRYSFNSFLCRTDAGAESLGTFLAIQRARNYGGWLHLTPAARFFDRRFTLCLFRSRKRTRYFLYAAAVLAGQHLHLSDVDLSEASKVFCAPTGPAEAIHFELDGELCGTLPATFEVVPDALTILVP